MAHGDKILAKIRAHPAFADYSKEHGNLSPHADHWVYLKETWKLPEGYDGLRVIHETSLVLCYEILCHAVPDIQHNLFENFPF